MLKYKNLALRKMFICSFCCTPGLEAKPCLLIYLAKAERPSSRACTGISTEDSSSDTDDANLYIHPESGSSLSMWAFTKGATFSQSLFWSALLHIYSHWTKRKNWLDCWVMKALKYLQMSPLFILMIFPPSCKASVPSAGLVKCFTSFTKQKDPRGRGCETSILKYTVASWRSIL